jgi:serine/threonine-protein kinase HipA
MSSDPINAFVWTWLPGAHTPVVAGRLDERGESLLFTYGRSYLERPDAIPLYLPELPLRPGPIVPLAGDVAGCIADSGPDSWGQRVIQNRRATDSNGGADDPNFLTYLLESGSDRIGALDFQDSPTKYVERSVEHPTLDDLARAAELVEQGVPLSPELSLALLYGSAIGGARPKSLLTDGNRHLIAKFSSSTDTYPVVKAEFVAMELARRVGLNVARVEITRSLGKDVLLVERFDRPAGGSRRARVSAMTILELDEMSARYASYADLADVIRSRFTEPEQTLRELFARITFNILVGNNDDHARNHSAFWDGSHLTLTLTPAYDICPQPRSGGETAQLMAIGRDGYRMSQVAGCVDRASVYLLSEAEARFIIDHQISVIEAEWPAVCDDAGMSEADRARMWHRQFLNSYATEGY